MNITLKNVKYSEFMSQETNCFEAAIYIDGKRAGEVSNDGHGGANRYHPYALEATINDYAKTLPPVVYDWAGRSSNEEPLIIEQDADTITGNLIVEWLQARDLKKTLSKYVVYTKDDGKIYQTKFKDHKAALAHPDLMLRVGAKRVLNFMPFEQAMALYKGVSA